eukprot:GFKZ01001513.1.p1 GENE.GFKZ01001513.1~~GFKZ01001513.1.p1  ORF type:complete len:357 (+),score=30.18 GFKZ01001513.1:41-1111(+)
MRHLAAATCKLNLFTTPLRRKNCPIMAPAAPSQGTHFPQAPLTDLAAISFAELTSTDQSRSDLEVARLLKVCQTCGFFYLKEHAVSPSLIRRVIDSSRNFFHLANDTKEEFGQHMHLVQPATCRGYVATENLNINSCDSKQVFDLGIPRDLIPGKRFSGPNVLPPDNIAPDFGKSLLDLQDDVMSRLVPGLCRAFGLALGLGADFFDPYMKEPTLIQRVIYYPPKEGLAGKHTDNGLFTILIQETLESRSLQVFTGGKWVPVEAREDRFVVNIGDIMQFWTSGKFVSTPHMVRHNCESSERLSFPFFVYPDIDSSFIPFNKEGESPEEIRVVDVMDRNFSNIWVDKTGAGRARELD